MNIHPLFVHFPIALFTLYALFEMGSFGRLQKNTTWKVVKSVFLICGFLSSFLALQTGKMAEEIVGRSDLTQKHSFFATTSIWIFVLPVFAYFVFWFESAKIFELHKAKVLKSKFFAEVYMILLRLSTFLLHRPVITLVAFAGLVAISITGALGGALAYSPDVDPFVKFIYELVM